MIAGPVEKRTSVGSRASALELFMTELARIAPEPGDISPRSRLISDLGFDPLAFGQLALLLYERYGVGALPVASLRPGSELTVEDFFDDHVAYAEPPSDGTQT